MRMASVDAGDAPKLAGDRDQRPKRLAGLIRAPPLVNQSDYYVRPCLARRVNLALNRADAGADCDLLAGRVAEVPWFHKILRLRSVHPNEANLDPASVHDHVGTGAVLLPLKRRQRAVVGDRPLEVGEVNHPPQVREVTIMLVVSEGRHVNFHQVERLDSRALLKGA